MISLLQFAIGNKYATFFSRTFSTKSVRCALSRSTASRQLVVPPAKLSTYGRRAFAISGPRIWNSLPDYLKDSELSIDIFKRYLKTYFSLAINYSTLWCIRDSVTVRYIDLLLRLRLPETIPLHGITAGIHGITMLLTDSTDGASVVTSQ